MRTDLDALAAKLPPPSPAVEKAWHQHVVDGIQFPPYQRPVDPVEAMVAKDTARDHARAAARGDRLARIVDRVVDELLGCGRALTEDQQDALRAALFTALADEFYGNASIDVPIRGRR